MAGVFVLAVLVLGVATAVRVFSKRLVLIVPAFELSDAGSLSMSVTGRTIANLVSDEMQAINEAANSALQGAFSARGDGDGWRVSNRLSLPPLPDFELGQSPEPNEVRVEVAGLSLDRLRAEFTRVSQRRTILVGDAIFEPRGVTLRARMKDYGRWSAGPDSMTTAGLTRASRQLALQVLSELRPDLAGGYHLSQNNLAQALELLRRRLAQDSGDATTHLALGITFQRMGELDSAATYYQHAAKLEPEASVYRALAVVSLQKGDLESANHWLAKVRDATGEVGPGIWVESALALYRAGLSDSAVRTLDMAIEQFPNQSALYTALGFALIGELSDFIPLGDAGAGESVLRLSARYESTSRSTDAYAVGLRDTTSWAAVSGSFKRPDRPGERHAQNRATRSIDQEWLLSPMRPTADVFFVPPPRRRAITAPTADDASVDSASTAFRNALRLAPNDPAAHHNVGVVLTLKDSLAEAVARFQNAIALDSTFVQAWVELGNAFLLQGSNDSAAMALDRALELGCHDLVCSYLLGVAYARTGALAEAAVQLRTALKVGPDHAASNYALGVTLLRRDTVKAAIESLAAALSADSAFVEARYQLGLALLRDRRTTEAIGILDAAHGLPEARYALGLAHLQASNAAQAVWSLQQAVDSMPRFAQGHYALGFALGLAGRRDAAVASLRNALRHRSDYPEAEYLLGASLMDVGQPQDAEVHFRRALDLKGPYPEAEYALGLAMMDLDPSRPEEPLLRFQNAVAYAPTWSEAHTAVGVTLFLNGRVEESLASLHRAVEFNPRYGIGLHNLGVAWARQGVLDSAITNLTAALTSGRAFAETYYILGFARLWNGQYDESVRSFRAAVGDIPAAQYGLSTALFLGGKVEEAITSYRTTVNRFPEAYTDLGTALLLSGRVDEAIDALRRALEHDPNDKIALNNLAWGLYHEGEEAALAEAARLSDQSLAVSGLDPDEQWMYRDTRANIALDMGDPGLALELFNEAILVRAADPQNVGLVAMLLLGKGMALLELGRQAEAVVAFREAKDIDVNALVPGFWEEQLYSAQAVARLRRLRDLWVRS